MYNHAPPHYTCPLCLAIQGTENQQTMMKQADIFYRDKLVMAAVNSKFVGKNPGHVIVVPLQHYENLYDLPEKEAHQVMLVAKEIAIALKTIRHCDGVMIQQNNEPASGQHAFHYHMHVFPRFEDDNWEENQTQVRIAPSAERLPFAKALREYFQEKRI